MASNLSSSFNASAPLRSPTATQKESEISRPELMQPFLKNGDLVTDFCERYAPKARGVLVPYAAEVVLIVRIGGMRLAAKYFSERFGRKLSKRPVEDLMRKVELGEIAVSDEDLARAAEAHPLAKRHLSMKPSIATPKNPDPKVAIPSCGTLIPAPPCKKESKSEDASTSGSRPNAAVPDPASCAPRASRIDAAAQLALVEKIARGL